MTSKNLLVYLVAVFALVAIASSVSAFGEITGVEVNGVQAICSGCSIDFANFAGQKVPILVTFVADPAPSGADPEAILATDVRVKAWFSGESNNAAVSERFDVIPGRLYTRVVYLDVPFDLKDSLNEPRKLMIAVENREETADQKEIEFTVQRESYRLDILDVNMQPEIRAGESLAVDVVLKNRGSHLADDAFVTIKIPELGISTRTYFGDLSPIDQGGNVVDKEDAVERRTYVRIPVEAKSGLYTVQVEAYNSDSVARIEKRLSVSGASEGALVVPSMTSKTFAVGETAEYKLTLVNRGSVIAVYQLTANAPRDLNVEVSEPLVVVPAGSSKTVSIMANTPVRDDYTFSVSVNSEEGTPVSQHTFIANVVEGSGRGGTGSFAGTSSNATVLLTVILAIIFIVLLVVLIVLLTRKPETKEEYGESYY